MSWSRARAESWAGVDCGCACGWAEVEAEVGAKSGLVSIAVTFAVEGSERLFVMVVLLLLTSSRGFVSEEARVRFGRGEVGRDGGGWIGFVDIRSFLG